MITIHNGNNEKLWCKDLLPKNKCNTEFDFSDHIVLHIVQFILPCALELHHNIIQYNRHIATNNRILTSQSQLLKPGNAANNNINNPIITYLLPSSLIAIVIIMISLRSILLTAMFFHTPAESAVGTIIALVFSLIPISISNRFIQFWLQHAT
eukprot:gene8582-11597_t